MPEEKTINWESIRLGNFIHKILEHGVQKNFFSIKNFIDYTKELHLKEEWNSVNMEEAEHLIRVFYERNKHKYSKNSKTEQKLNTEIDGIKFTGFADRIDFKPEGMEIIDYKTGSSIVSQKNRNWQLGYYALAAGKLGKVHKITLDMLKYENPLEFYLNKEGIAKAIYSAKMVFNIHKVKKELVQTAQEVLKAYKTGFKSCSIEKNCEFCNDYNFTE